MLRLYILRHAKSAWPMPSTGDHDRPLNQRGMNDLPNIRAMLVARGYHPQLAFCSSAKRTLLTWQGIASAFPDCVVETRDDLYESTTGNYFSLIKAINGNAPTMLIGHNPVCDDLTRLLITGEGDVAAEFLPTHFPTGGLAVIEFKQNDWSGIGPTTGKMVDFVRPRSLR